MADATKIFLSAISRPAASYAPRDSWINTKQLPEQVDWRARGIRVTPCDSTWLRVTLYNSAWRRRERDGGFRRFGDSGSFHGYREPLFRLRLPFNPEVEVPSTSTLLPRLKFRLSWSYDSQRGSVFEIFIYYANATPSPPATSLSSPSLGFLLS